MTELSDWSVSNPPMNHTSHMAVLLGMVQIYQLREALLWKLTNNTETTKKQAMLLWTLKYKQLLTKQNIFLF